MSWFTRTRIETRGERVKSLCWRGDALIDWVRGGASWTLDGRCEGPRCDWGYSRFDGAVADVTGRWAVVHERTGTAGLLLRDGHIVRAIHRAPSHADAYLFPVCLFQLNGRTLIAHCPDSYARIEIDDAETGERLTRSTSRKEADFFHSRLAASPSAKRLTSAGWYWHPWDAVVWFEIEAAIVDPTLLDRLDGSPRGRNAAIAEESSACWLDDDRILIGGSSEPEDADEAAELDREHPGPRLRPNGLAVYDVSSRAYTHAFDLGAPPGTMMPVGAHHVVTSFRRPRLVSLETGNVLHEWADIESHDVASSIVMDRPPVVMALDPGNARFAVAGKDGIDVVAIDVSATASP
jgi:hypothetical protein